MAFTAKQTSAGGFSPIPAGAYAAVCTSMVDLGLQRNTNPAYKPAFQLAITFQIPSERLDDGRPYEITQRFTFSMNQKANLRKFIENWFGKAFSSDEAAFSFDFEKLLGRSAFINVVHKSKGDKTYANIATVMQLPAGMPVPNPEGAPFYYDIDKPEHAHLYQRVPEWLRKLIESRVIENTAPAGLADAGADDIPF